MITAYGDEGAKRQALEVGAVDSFDQADRLRSPAWEIDSRVEKAASRTTFRSARANSRLLLICHFSVVLGCSTNHARPKRFATPTSPLAALVALAAGVAPIFDRA
jgi:hypothetical protein